MSLHGLGSQYGCLDFIVLFDCFLSSFSMFSICWKIGRWVLISLLSWYLVLSWRVWLVGASLSCLGGVFILFIA